MIINFTRLSHILVFELTRLFTTKRGWLSLIAFTTIWFIILYYFVASASIIVSSPSSESYIKQIFAAIGLSALLDWPVSEFAIYWLVSVYFFPCFAVLVCSDQLCSDKQRGTLRFISLRVSRLELLLGRYLGQLCIVTLLIVVTSLATMLLASIRDITLISLSLGLAAKLSFELMVLVMPFIALMTLLNTFLSSARLALVFATLTFTLAPLVIRLIQHQLGHDFYLDYLIPGGKIADILSQSNVISAQYLLPVIQTMIMLAISHAILKRASL